MAQAVQERVRCARRPKKCAAKNAKDNCKCGQSMNLGAFTSKIRCESNSRRTEYEQGNSATDCKGRFGNEKTLHKNGASNLDTWPETMLASHFIWSFTQCRDVWQGHYRWWNVVFSIQPGNKMTEHAMENTEFTSAEKSTHVSVTGQDHACVLLRSQGDSSLWIHCTRINGKSSVLFGNADKVTGICSEEKTRTLAW